MNMRDSIDITVATLQAYRERSASANPPPATSASSFHAQKTAPNAGRAISSKPSLTPSHPSYTGEYATSGNGSNIGHPPPSSEIGIPPYSPTPTAATKPKKSTPAPAASAARSHPKTPPSIPYSPCPAGNTSPRSAACATYTPICVSQPTALDRQQSAKKTAALLPTPTAWARFP